MTGAGSSTAGEHADIPFCAVVPFHILVTAERHAYHLIAAKAVGACHCEMEIE